MTEGPNRQLVLDFLNVLYSGDIEATLERCTDDVEFLANAPIDILPHMGHRRGKAEMREMWNAVRARYSELRCEVPMLVAEGDKVAAYHPRVLPQEHQSAHGAVRHRRLLHAARRQDQPDQGNHRYLRSGRSNCSSATSPRS